MYIFISILIGITILIIINELYKLEKLELFKSDYSDFNNIDRIKVDDKFAYCIGATPICETGVPIKGGIYTNGNTYKSYCDDGSNMVCNNFVSSNLDTCGNSYVWKTPTLNNKPILFSKTYQGFTEPTSYIPAVINNNSINFYDANSNIIDTINKCDILGIDTNNCKKALKMQFVVADTKTHWSGTDEYNANKINTTHGYDTDPTAVGSFDIGSYTEKIPQSNGKSGMYPNLPCIADYGALPGDNVCNGEIGLIQDETLICPYYKPICRDYRCGSTFGNCDYSN
jgi:hypothetical protein